MTSQSLGERKKGFCDNSTVHKCCAWNVGEIDTLSQNLNASFVEAISDKVILTVPANLEKN